MTFSEVDGGRPACLDLSVIVLTRPSQNTLHATLRSVDRAIEICAARGLLVERMAIQLGEGPVKYVSPLTGSYVWHQVADDEAMARNYGARLARGNFIGMIDCGNLMDPYWLIRAIDLCWARPEVILHPEYSVNFGAANFVFHHPSSRDQNFEPLNLFSLNPWSTTFVCQRNILRDKGLTQSVDGMQLAYPIWQWYADRLHDGYPIETVKSTAGYIRRGAGDFSQTFPPEPSLPYVSKLVSPDEACKRSPGCPAGSAENAADAGVRSERKGVIRRALRKLKSHLKTAPGTRQLFDLARAIRRRKMQGLRSECPAWLIENWRRMHALEPKLFPENWLLEQPVVRAESAPSASSLCYAEVCRQIGPECSHIFLLPWLRAAGADLEALNYIHGLTKTEQCNTVVVLTTEPAESPWRIKLPEGVRFLEVSKICQHISESDRQDLIAKVILHYKPQAVHNINSRLAYEMLCRHGATLKQVTNLYCLSFCLDVAPNGRRLGYPFKYLPECFPYLKLLLSDNQKLLDELEEIFGFDPERMRVHYQPVVQADASKVARLHQPGQRLEILWAGRLDRQKRPDVLQRIAKACEHMPVHFHVYGRRQLDGVVVNNTKNLTCHGAFSGFGSLPTERCHLFLYTAEWDGLPNAILEAMACGLPTIAPAVSGIPEIVRDGETGILIGASDDVDSYTSAISDILSQRVNAARLVNNAYRMLDQQHSWPAFLNELQAVPGYLLPADKSHGRHSVCSAPRPDRRCA